VTSCAHRQVGQGGCSQVAAGFSNSKNRLKREKESKCMIPESSRSFLQTLLRRDKNDAKFRAPSELSARGTAETGLIQAVWVQSRILRLI